MDMMAIRRRVIMLCAKKDGNLFDLSSVMSGTLDGYGKYSANANRTVTDYITLEAGTYEITREIHSGSNWWKAYKYEIGETSGTNIFNYGSGSSRVQFTLNKAQNVRIAFDYIVSAIDNVVLKKAQ